MLQSALSSIFVPKWIYGQNEEQIKGQECQIFKPKIGVGEHTDQLLLRIVKITQRN